MRQPLQSDLPVSLNDSARLLMFLAWVFFVSGIFLTLVVIAAAPDESPHFLLPGVILSLPGVLCIWLAHAVRHRNLAAAIGGVVLCTLLLLPTLLYCLGFVVHVVIASPETVRMNPAVVFFWLVSLLMTFLLIGMILKLSKSIRVIQSLRQQDIRGFEAIVAHPASPPERLAPPMGIRQSGETYNER